MAAHGWGKDSPLDESLYEEGYRFDFFQAVRLLEMGLPNSAPVGEGAEPSREPVRFKSVVGLAFPASDVAEVRPPEREGGAAQMSVNFMGLAGAFGPLQTPTTEQILDRARSRDTALRDFLDIFNHRLVSLFYRIRKVHRVGRDNRPPGADRLSALIYSTFGMGADGLRGRMLVKDRALLYYAGLLASRPRSLVGLCRIVRDYFRVPVSGVEFCGRWLNLDEGQWTAIGASGRNARLGEGALVGRRVWDQHAAFELRLGPLALEEFENFLPTGWGFGPLCDLARFYTGDELDFTVRLTLKREEAPPARLNSLGGARLSWTSWLMRGDLSSSEPPPGEVVGPFSLLPPPAWSKGDLEVVVSPASLRAFPVALRVPYFELPPDKLAELVGMMTPLCFYENRVVLGQGEMGDSLFVIVSGEVRISRRAADGSETTLATLRDGDYFGEVAVITGKPRNATVVTLRKCEMLELSKAALDQFRARYPRFDATLKEYAETRK